jgi:hypothetical protein
MLDMMKRKLKNVIVLSIVIIAVFAIVAVVAVVASSYSDKQYAKSHDGCSVAKVSHMMVIQNNQVLPSNIMASRCDTLIITNNDSIRRLMAFGLHEDHVPYDGIAEQVLYKDQSLIVTLIQAGSFRFHDHLHDEVQGTFTVR